MDLRDVHAEIVALRVEIKAYHEETTANKTDLQWVKKIVFGGFTVMFTVLGSLLAGALGTH